MKAFVNSIKKKKNYPHSFRDEFEILQILDLIETSSKSGRKLTT